VLPPPARSSGRRRYTHAILRQLALIEVAQQAGFTLAEIRALRLDPRRQWRELAARKLGEVDRLLRRAHAMKRLLRRGMECRCTGPEDCALLAPAP